MKTRNDGEKGGKISEKKRRRRRVAGTCARFVMDDNFFFREARQPRVLAGEGRQHSFDRGLWAGGMTKHDLEIPT